MPTARTRAPQAKAPKSARPKAASAPAKPTLADLMKALEEAGSAQTRKTYARHGAAGPMFGVSFATLKVLAKKVGVDHDLARALWATGNVDARNLAMKVADPAKATAADLDRWTRETTMRMCAFYPPMIASEGAEGFATAKRWLASSDERMRGSGWILVGLLAARDEGTPEEWLAARLAEIEKRIHLAPNAERYAMNGALIAIGGRSASLRQAALAAAKRIGTVDVDHGDTSCKTHDASSTIEKSWAYAKSKGFDSPSAQERHRDPPRTRC